MSKSKKRLIFCLDFITIFLELTMFVIVVSSVLVIGYLKLRTENLRYQNEVLNEHRQTIDKLTFDGEIDEFTKQYATAQLNKIPERYLEYLDDWEIIITAGRISNIIALNNYTVNKSNVMAANNAFSGVCSYNQKKIHINANEYSIYRAMAHEIGHALEYYIDKPSNTDEFNAIYEKEKDLLFSEDEQYYTLTTKEYWAESFRLFVLDREKLHDLAPETYQFIFKKMLSENFTNALPS